MKFSSKKQPFSTATRDGAVTRYGYISADGRWAIDYRRDESQVWVLTHIPSGMIANSRHAHTKTEAKVVAAALAAVPGFNWDSTSPTTEASREANKRARRARLAAIGMDTPESVSYGIPGHWHRSLRGEYIVQAAKESMLGDTYTAICINCASERSDLEPDTRGVLCDECRQMSVYSAEELLHEVTEHAS